MIYPPAVVPVQGGYQLFVITGVHDWLCMTQKKWILREFLNPAPFFLEHLSPAEHCWANPPVGEGGKSCKGISIPSQQRKKPRHCQYLYLDLEIHILILLYFSLRVGQTGRIKNPLSLGQNQHIPLHFLFLPSQFPPLTLLQLSPDQQALRTPIKLQSEKDCACQVGFFFPQVLTDLIFTTCEQVFAVLKMCWVIAHARHLPFSAPSVFKAFFFLWEHPC